jgi:hypothetical protein
MKTIQTLVQTAIIVAYLAPATYAASRLRGGKPSTRPLLKSWAVSYDTSRACLTGKAGRVVATIKPAGSTTAQRQNNSRGALVVFRVAGQGHAAPYVQTTRIQSNGRATVPISVMGALLSEGRTATNFACTVQVGNGAVQKVACPTLPDCIVDEGPGFVAPTASPTILEGPDFLAPTSSPTIFEGPGILAPTEAPTPDESGLLAPTEAPTPDESGLLAPTEVPTPEGTENPLYSITMESGPVADPPSCLDASLIVTVLHNGEPVEGRVVSLLVAAAAGRDYEARAVTDHDGVATLSVTLDPADQNKELWTSLAVENTILSQYQHAVPALNFGC